MTMQYAHLAQSHKLSAVELLASVQLPEPKAEGQAEPTVPKTVPNDFEHVATASEHIH